MILFSRERMVPNTAFKHTFKIIFYPSNQKIKTTEVLFFIYLIKNSTAIQLNSGEGKLILSPYNLEQFFKKVF